MRGRHLPHAGLVFVSDATPLARGHDAVMTGNGGHHHRRPTEADRAFFEALLVLRDRYAARNEDDANPVIGVRHAIVAASAAMADDALASKHRPGISRN